MKAVAYYRTSSATNVGGDSLERQRSAVETWATSNGVEVVEEFYDPAVSGADPVHTRKGFADLLARPRGCGRFWRGVGDRSVLQGGGPKPKYRAVLPAGVS